jgi:amino acid adenylation domain-containing protein
MLGSPVVGDAPVREEPQDGRPDPRAALSDRFEGGAHEVFSRLAHAAPEHVAIRDAAGEWTYGALDRRSNQLAHRLREAGIGAGDRVAIGAERTAWMVCAMLAVMKTGAAFCALDPRFPPARLAQLLALAKPRVLLRIGAFPVDGLDVPVFAAETAGEGRSEAALGVGVAADDVAYIAFTSGSTGVPKGVLGRHGSLSHFVPDLVERFAFRATDRFSMLSGLAHDPLHRDTLLPLQLGATICVPDPGALDAGARLVAWMARERVTVCHVTPSLGELLAGGRLDALRLVTFLGEPVTRQHVARMRAAAPNAQLVTSYGATETARAVTAYAIPHAPAWDISPVGRGIADVQLLVVSTAHQLCAVGELGEVWFRSPHLALGYLDDVAATRAAFQPDPITGRDIAYRTGDLGRYLPNGDVVLAGRADDQIKLRGFRIELGEIEAVLRAHPGVRSATVIVRDVLGEQRLVGYVAPRVAVTELRAHLAAQLPDYMVPLLVALDELPRLPSGKLDRRALPMPVLATGGVAPRDEIEQRLLAIWEALLGVHGLGVTDGFFEAGGHSLLAVRMCARIEHVFGVSLGLADIFGAPTIEALAQRIRAGTHVPPLVAQPRGAASPLSFAQQRLWFLDQLAPDSTAYHMAFAYRLRGRLDVATLRARCAAIVARHEILRTVFPVAGGVTEHRVQAAAVELVAGDGSDAWLAALVRHRYDLAAGPLLRIGLARVADDDHVLCVAMHHIIADGWSLDVLVRELAEPPRAPPGAQYADWAIWQRGWLAGDVLERQLAYWKQQLANAPAELALPVRGAPRAGSPCDRIVVMLDADVVARLHALARAAKTTWFVVCAAALRFVLARTCGQDELCLGTAIANRGPRAAEDLVGLFVNTVVLRGHVDGRERFTDLLAREHAAVVAAHANADAPFESVVAALGLERRADRVPLIQVMVIDQGTPSELVLPGVIAERIDLHAHEAAKLELVVETTRRADGQELALTFDTDVLDRATVAALADRLVRALASIAARPDAPLAALDLLAPADRARFFDEPARSIAWEPRPPVIDRIEAQLAATPDAIAVIDAGVQTTYAALDERTARLAAHLRARGVVEERIVAIVADRGLAMVVAALGVMRAGGAYVPIKPDLPAKRIAWMLEDTAPCVILCQGPPPAALAGEAHRIVRIDDDHGPGTPPPRAHLPDALAYIIYTSGSTGRPKGVMIPRRGFDAQLAWMQDVYELRASDRVMQLASPLFDFSVIELFWPLLAGAAIVVVPPRAELEPRELAQLATSQRATVVHFVPSLLRAVVDACRARPWTSIRAVFAGGEALPLDLARAVGAVFPRAALHNQYGPTETSINATYHACSPADTEVPIGRAVGDTTLYVLDEHLSPVPPGCAGELWIGGVQLARGYLARPALTAERFIPSPFASRPGERIYKTGDRVRQRDDGSLVYLGRSDVQVKVRGFRIELGEVEAALHAHPAVRAAAVAARTEAVRGTHLVAYVCLAAPVDTATLREHLARRLPDYMVPSAFVVLDALPLTATGKLDRNALPAPTRADPGRVALSPTAQALAAIWCELLGVEHVGAEENFFSLGGHSLLVVALVSRIVERFGADVTARWVFERPTLHAQAAALDDRSRVEASEDPGMRELADWVATLSEAELAHHHAQWTAVQHAGVARSGDLRRELRDHLRAQHHIDAHPTRPLARRTAPTTRATFAQQVQWDFRQRGNFDALGVHATAFAVRGPLDLSAMQRALVALCARQGALRATFADTPAGLQMTTHAHAPAVDVVDLAQHAEAERVALARARFAALSRPHDLATEVMRAQVLRLAADEHLVFVVPHHIIADGFSWDVIEGDLVALYAAERGAAPPPPLPVSFADFCFWQTSLEQRPIGRAQLAHWARALEGYAPLALPGDRGAMERASVGLALDTYERGAVPIAIEHDAWRAVEQLCAQHAITPFTAIATAFYLLLVRWGRRDDACTMTGSVHRDRPGTPGVIGNFATPYPLRVRFDGARTRGDALRICHETILVHREHTGVAPTSALGAFCEWSRYNLNYLFAPGARAAHCRGIVVERMPWNVHPRRTPHDFALFVRQGAHALHGELAYNAERFSPELVARVGAWFTQLVAALATDPERTLASLPAEP